MMNIGKVGAMAIAALLAVAACSGLPGGSASSPQTRAAAPPATRAQPQSVLYVGAMQGSLFDGYRLSDRQPSCAHVSENQSYDYAIGVDAAGNLWMPQVFYVQGGANVKWYPPNCGSVGGSLSVPSNYIPEAIAFGSDGTKYVLNWSATNSIVSEYAVGSTSPTGELSDPRINARAFAVGVDAAQNIYVSCCDDKSRHRRHGIYLIVFKAGGKTDRGERLNVAQLGIPGGSILFDRSGNMLVPDQQYANLNVYAPPFTQSPTVYPLKGIPAQCALDPQQTTLACASGEPFFLDRPRLRRHVVPGVNTVDLYAYPSLRFRYGLKNRFGKDYQVVGVAFAPLSQQ